MTRLKGKVITQRIDHALIEPGTSAFNEVVDAISSLEARKLAELVRRRATLLSRQMPDMARRILRVRDRLILFIYARDVPLETYSGWCDASLKQTPGETIAAISGLLISPSGRLIHWLSRRAEEDDAVRAEAMAVSEVMRAAIENGVERLRVHNDCAALIQLWLEQRDDPRLEILRRLAGRLHRFELHAIPRLHNQPADRLAKRALDKAMRFRAQR